MKSFGLIDKAFLLKRTPLFESLDLDLLLTFADKLTVSQHDEGDELFQVDQEAHKMFFVAKGEVVLHDRNDDMLALLGPPLFFGDESLFNECPRPYSAVARTDLTLLSLSRSHLNMIISEAPVVAQRFLHLYAQSLPHLHRFQVEEE